MAAHSRSPGSTSMRKSSGGSGSGSLVDAFRVGRTRKFARENEAQQTAKRKQDEALVIEVDEEDTQAAPPLSPPVHLHKFVQYDREGVKSLSEGKRRVFAFVQEYYDIPSDLERNHKYGPLSGFAYEERAINAYMNGLLELKSTHLGRAELRICYTCGGVGHWPDVCPEGF